MENIQRNLEKEVARLRLPKLSKKDRHWTFLLVGDHGEILSVRWFKGLAIALALVLVVAVVVLFRMGFIYKSATEENKNLKQALADSQQRVVSLRNEKDLLGVRLVIAESKVKANPAEIQEKQPVIKSAVTGKPGLVAEKSQAVAVKKFITLYEPDNKILKMQFKIVNTSPDSQPVSGYAFVILKPNDVKQEKWTVLPSVALISGKPSLIEKGQAFLIYRFRKVEFSADGQTDPNLFKKATVVIYSTDGKLLLEKDFTLNIEGKTVSTTPTNG